MLIPWAHIRGPQPVILLRTLQVTSILGVRNHTGRAAAATWLAEGLLTTQGRPLAGAVVMVIVNSKQDIHQKVLMSSKHLESGDNQDKNVSSQII